MTVSSSAPVPPILTPLQVAEAVVDRLCGFASPDAVAVGELLISVDPESIRLARLYETRVRRLAAEAEDPVAKFERLTGRTLGPPPAR